MVLLFRWPWSATSLGDGAKTVNGASSFQKATPPHGCLKSFQWFHDSSHIDPLTKELAVMGETSWIGTMQLKNTALFALSLAMLLTPRVQCPDP
jgi:hypothetical protein